MSNIIYKKVYPHEVINESGFDGEQDQHEKSMDCTLQEGFIQKLENSLSLTPLPERIETAEKFIAAAKEVSALYELDIEIRRHDSCISVDLAFDNGCGIKGLNKVFGMADEFGFVSGIKGRDVIVSMQYYTHAVILNGRKIAP